MSKPQCKLIGENGNIFNLLGIASKTLKKVGKDEESSEMCKRVFACDSYHKALTIIGEYVDII